jgi:protein SCO1/2
MSHRWKLLAPLIVILFPVVLWLVLTRGHNKFDRLPFFGPFEISASGDTIYHSIPPFEFVNQKGKKISSKDVDGKIFVANFFFATCPTICPKMNNQVYRIQEEFKNNDNIRILSFTVDPESDSVEALAAYAGKMNANDSVWWFLTGNKDSIYALAREGFFVPAAIGEKENDFFHSQNLILVDREKRMRGIYDGLEKAEVDTLIDEIKVLLKEYQ